MDPSARSTAAQIVLVNITMEMVTTSAAPSPDPSGQSPPSLSSSDLTYTSPNQASVQHGQLKQPQPQLQQLQQIQQQMDAGVGLKELELLKIGLLEEPK